MRIEEAAPLWSSFSVALASIGVTAEEAGAMSFSSSSSTDVNPAFILLRRLLVLFEACFDG